MSADAQVIKGTLQNLFCAAGIEKLTRANAKAFWEKIDAWQNRYGPFLHKRMLTEADVKAHIGLSLW